MKQGTTDGRRNNKGVTKPLDEKKVPLTFQVKLKNKDKIRERLLPIVKKIDK